MLVVYVRAQYLQILPKIYSTSKTSTPSSFLITEFFICSSFIQLPLIGECPGLVIRSTPHVNPVLGSDIIDWKFEVGNENKTRAKFCLGKLSYEDLRVSPGYPRRRFVGQSY